MFQQLFASRRRALIRTRRARHVAAALVIGLALALMGAACVTGQPTGTASTATPKPNATATPTPAPCSARCLVSSPNAGNPCKAFCLQ